jgi:hypothetical protein
MVGRGFTFGIYPGSVAGTESGYAEGRPDDPGRIGAALDELQDAAGRLSVRGYLPFRDAGDRRAGAPSPAAVHRYARPGRRLDLVAQYQSAAGDVDGYVGFVRRLVRRYGPDIAALQIGEEPESTGNPVLDGYYPRVREAVVAGVIAASQEARAHGLTDLEVGCNTAPMFGGTGNYLAELAEYGGDEWRGALDYVGLNFFPDVFHPIPLADLHTSVTGLLRAHVHRRMRAAALPVGVALRITENGWPTGPGRSPRRQARVLTGVVEAVLSCRAELNIRGYSYFALRDADSANPGLFHQFGLVRDDYRPKPAFAVYRDLLRRHRDGL